MSSSQTRLYLGLGFLAGVLLTLGFKDVYPDLERRFHRKLRKYPSLRRISRFGSVVAVQLTDNTVEKSVEPDVDIPVGIEGCIGNTPLFKIRSLSEATGWIMYV